MKRHWGLFIIGLLLLGACARSVPGQPQDVSVSRTLGGLLITWKDTSSGELQETGFMVKRDGRNLVTKAPNVTQHLDTTADVTKTYTYQVCAVIGGKEVCSKEAPYPNTGGGKVTLTLLRAGGGSGIITSTPAGINCNHVTGSGCSASFSKGITVTLTAVPNTGSALLGYSDNCKKTGDTTCRIVMDGNKEVTETMVEAKPGLNVVLSGDSNAGVVVDLNTSPRFEYINCGTDCNEPLPVGTVVVIEARPNPEAVFGGWQNCLKVEGSTGNRCRVTLEAVTIVGASFYKNASKPKIDSFKVTPEKLATSGDVTLEWIITAPTPDVISHISISDGVKDVCSDTPKLNDSCKVKGITASTTFTLNVDSVFGTETATATVTVGDAATITKFEVVGKPSPVIIARGDPITLSWGVAGAEPLSVTLSSDKGFSETVTADGSKEVSPFSDTVYTLTAKNDFGGPVSQSITVTVGDKPVIKTFKASSTRVPVGGTSTLSWDVEPAGTTLSFEPSIGSFNGNSKELTFLEEGVFTYTLTASNIFGTTVSEPVVITVGRAPEITGFSADPEAIPSGSTSGLAWAATGTAPITFSIDQGVGSVTGGSTSVTPTTTTTYTLTASNDFGTDTATATVKVGDPPVIDRFEVDGVKDLDVVSGTEVMFTWSVVGAASLEITPDIGAVSGASASVVVSGALGETKTYTLTATSSIGLTATDTVQIKFIPAGLPIISRFRANPDEIKEGKDTTLEWRVSGAQSLILQDGKTEQIVTGDKIKVSPKRDTTYTLIAKNKSGETSASVRVKVED